MESIGSKEWSLGKGLVYLVCVICIFVLLPWFSSNVEGIENREKAQWFWQLGMSFFVISLIAGILRRANLHIMDTCIYEKKTNFGELPLIQKATMVSGLVFFFFLLLAFINFRHEALIAAPTFQIQYIQLGDVGHSMLSFLFAMSEGLIFVGFIPPTVYILAHKATRSYYFSAFLAIMIAPLIFTWYHFAKYGAADMAGSITVFILNFVSIAWLLTFRNILFEFVVFVVKTQIS